MNTGTLHSLGLFWHFTSISNLALSYWIVMGCLQTIKVQALLGTCLLIAFHNAFHLGLPHTSLVPAKAACHCWPLSVFPPMLFQAPSTSAPTSLKAWIASQNHHPLLLFPLLSTLIPIDSSGNWLFSMIHRAPWLFVFYPCRKKSLCIHSCQPPQLCQWYSSMFFYSTCPSNP